MIEIWNSLHAYYTNWFYPEFVSLVVYLANHQIGVYILVAVLIVFTIVRTRIKIPKLQQFLDFICGMITILLMIVAYYIFSPSITRFFNSIDIPAVTQSATTQNNATQNPSSTNRSTKQLYYSVGCYDCYADSCVKNGYSYGGYDANYFSYIKSLCQSCSCNSLRAQSLWR